MSDVPPSKTRAILHLYVRPLLLVAIPIAVFTLARFVLLLRYPDAFTALSGAEKAAAFLQGLRYDASVLFPILGFPVLMLLLPFSASQGRRWQEIWGWIGFALFAATFFVLAADVVYFGYVQRHAGIETVALGETLKAVTSSALTSHLPALILFGLLLAALAWGWTNLLARDPKADGQFVYAVKTTGIYCNPSSLARLPKPQTQRAYSWMRDGWICCTTASGARSAASGSAWSRPSRSCPTPRRILR